MGYTILKLVDNVQLAKKNCGIVLKPMCHTCSNEFLFCRCLIYKIGLDYFDVNFLALWIFTSIIFQPEMYPIRIADGSLIW